MIYKTIFYLEHQIIYVMLVLAVFKGKLQNIINDIIFNDKKIYHI